MFLTIPILTATAVAFLLSYLLTGVVIRIAPNIGLSVQPNHRSAHDGVMPLGGGIGFVVPFVVLSSFLLYFEYLSLYYWLVVVGCGGLIFIVGLWDDIVDVPIILRLLVQFACVSTGVWLLGGWNVDATADQGIDIGLVGCGLSVVVLIWWLNLFNFMDGIDGLAGLEAIFIAFGAIVIFWLKYWLNPLDVSPDIESVELLLFILSASVFGFLVFNWAPARVFMGDAGSTFLGFALGMIALISVELDALSVSSWLILGAVFWVDATFTLIRRILVGERWYLAHKSHAYQHALSLMHEADRIYSSKIITRLFFSRERHAHKGVCLLILTINLLWLLPLASLAVILPKLEFIFVLFAWAPLIWVVYRLGAGKEQGL